MSGGKLGKLARQLARRRTRRQVGPLRDRLVAPRTLQRYRAAVAGFFRFTWEEFQRMPRDSAELDRWLCLYIEKLWQDGDGKSWATDAKCALGHFLPATCGPLNGARRLILAWGKHELPERAPPLPAGYAAALAGAALVENNGPLCLTILLGFHALLRTGELVQVRAGHFVPSARPGGLVLLTLPWTKSGQRHQSVAETVVLSDPVLLAFVHAWVPQMAPDTPLYGGGAQGIRRDFTRLCRTAGLPAQGWRPYSLRRGGATAHFLQFGSLDRTAVRGRWQSTKTARIYINEGIATLAEIAATPAQEQRMSRMRHALLHPRQR